MRSRLSFKTGEGVSNSKYKPDRDRNEPTEQGEARNQSKPSKRSELTAQGKTIASAHITQRFSLVDSGLCENCRLQLICAKLLFRCFELFDE